MVDDALLESLKFENKLLTELNQELKDNNRLLKDKLFTLEAELKTHKENSSTSVELSEHKDYLNKIKEIISKELQNYFTQFNNNNNYNIHENIQTNNKKQQKIMNEDKQQKINDKTVETQKIYSNQKDGQSTSHKKQTDVEQKKYSDAVRNVNVNKLRDLENKQRMIMQNVIHLDKPINPTSGINLQPTLSCNENQNTNLVQLIENENESGFHYQGRRNKLRENNADKKPKKNLGTGESLEEGDPSGFSGIDKKVWIYVYRCKRVCKAEDIKQYIHKKPGFDEVQVDVQELSTNDKQNKCFVVSAPFDKKDIMYKPDFWPRNVGFKRFHFKKFKDYSQGDFL